MSKEPCTCCALAEDNADRPERADALHKGFFLSGLSFGMLHLGEDLPLRLCTRCKAATMQLMKDLREKFEKINGYALGQRPLEAPKGTALN